MQRPLKDVEAALLGSLPGIFAPKAGAENVHLNPLFALGALVAEVFQGVISFIMKEALSPQWCPPSARKSLMIPCRDSVPHIMMGSLERSRIWAKPAITLWQSHTPPLLQRYSFPCFRVSRGHSILVMENEVQDEADDHQKDDSPSAQDGVLHHAVVLHFGPAM